MRNPSARHASGSTWVRTTRTPRFGGVTTRSRARKTALAAGSTAGALVLGGVFGASPAAAVQSDPALGTARAFAVLAGSTVTNTGPSLISGDLGVAPGTALTGFPPGKVINGVPHSANASAALAELSLTTAWVDAAGRGPATSVPADIGNRTLKPGVYNRASGMFSTGTVTLDAQNDPKAVFIFQAGSTLITASNSRVKLINGAQPCNVYWQVGSSATLGTNTDFIGTVMALSSATLNTGATVEGRILARNGAVTLDTNTIRLPRCDETVTPDSTRKTGGMGGSGDTTSGGGTSTGGSGSSSTGGGGTSSKGGSGGSSSGGSGGSTSRSGSGGGSSDSSSGGHSSGGAPDGPQIPPGHPHTGLGGTS